MPDGGSRFQRWLAELRRRKVFRVAVAYVVAGWALIQVADATFEPLGLPLWLVVTLGVTFWGPFDLADAGDLSGGSALEASGRQLLLWQTARHAMLFVFCGMGAAIFLGGWYGPLLPGWAWMLLKTLALVWLVTWLGHRLGRIPAERAVSYLWTVGLPLSFVDLLVAGLEALLKEKKSD